MSWAEIKKVNSNLSISLDAYQTGNYQIASANYPVDYYSTNRTIFSIEGKGFVHGWYIYMESANRNPTDNYLYLMRTYKILADDEIWDNHKLNIQPGHSTSYYQSVYGYMVSIAANKGTNGNGAILPKLDRGTVNTSGIWLYDYPLSSSDTPREDGRNTYVGTGAGAGIISPLLAPIPFSQSFEFIAVQDSVSTGMTFNSKNAYLCVLYTLVE